MATDPGARTTGTVRNEAEAEAELLRRVRPLLAGEIGVEAARNVMVLHTGPSRRRSSLYFLGLDGHPQWVVKQPHRDSQQADLPAPRSAATQYDALCRLYAHLGQGSLARAGGPFATPCPVGFLPELDAYVMEFVPGPTMTGLIRPRTVVRPGVLLSAVTSAGELLRAVHALEPAEPEDVDLGGLGGGTVVAARRVLDAAGLPAHERWFAPSGVSGTTRAPRVLLHGDFAPENVVLSRSGLCCLEPDLCDRSWAEHDVVRFLLMFVDAPMVVVAADLPPVQALRRRVSATFLAAYYGDADWPATLQPLFVGALTSRWATRHTDLRHRPASLRSARELVLRRHFTRMLDEVSSPSWPGSIRPRR